MKVHFKSCRAQRTICNTERIPEDPIVQNGLAITPAQMLELTHQGFAISAQNSRMLAEAKSTAVGYVPLEYRRGFDMADAYQAMRSVHAKAREAVDRLRKGDNLPLDSPIVNQKIE